jgi:hypothetical protein
MIRRVYGSVACAAVLTFAMSAAPAMAAGALAVGKCGAYGYSFDADSPREARRTAMEHCQGDGCRVVLDFHRFCAAFAWDTGRNCGAQGWGSGPNPDAARRAAVDQCSQFGGTQCEVRKVTCDRKG